MSWPYPRRDRWFGAAVLIAVGVIGLLANFNLISAEVLNQFWKLWPLIPLVIGVGILMRRSRYSNEGSPRDGRKD